METTRPRLSGFLAIVVVLFTASAALGAVGAVTEATGEEPVPTEAPPCPTDPGDEGGGEETRVDGEVLAADVTDGDLPDAGSTDDGDTDTDGDSDSDSDSDECDEPEDADGEDAEDAEDQDAEEPEEEPAPEVVDDEERLAACETAAGISEGGTGGEDVDQEAGTHGLDNAIEHVLGNCVKNPQAPGLLNALERLVANRDRHEAHEEWKAARAEERAAAKAARAAAKAAGSHGNAGGNGFGATHGGGNGVGHGNGNSNAGGNGHGNGHP